MTKQRKQIYETIMQSPRHMTAEEIYDAVRVRMPGVARATVYRNLGLMERDGQVRRVRMPDAPDRYDRSPVPHQHIHCPRCGALEDLELEGFAQRLEERIGRPVTALSLYVQALCSGCAAKAGEGVREDGA